MHNSVAGQVLFVADQLLIWPIAAQTITVSPHSVFARVYAALMPPTETPNIYTVDNIRVFIRRLLARDPTTIIITPPPSA